MIWCKTKENIFKDTFGILQPNIAVNCDLDSADNHWCKYFPAQLNKAMRTDVLFVLYHMDIRRALSITRLYSSGIAIFQTKQKRNTMFLEGMQWSETFVLVFLRCSMFTR